MKTNTKYFGSCKYRGPPSPAQNLYSYYYRSIVLWLGNVTFKKMRDDSSEIISKEAIQIVAELLGCAENDLEKVLITRIVTAKNERYPVRVLASQVASWN